MENRQLIVERLVQAERHVAQGEDHIRRQKRVIAEYERAGPAEGVPTAHRPLEDFKELQQAHVAARDRWRAELEDFRRHDDTYDDDKS